MNFLFLLSCIYFFLPAYFTNMAPVLASRINVLAAPVDLGKTIKGRPVLGSHKTWRGVIFGLMAGIIIAYLQLWLFQFSLIKGISFFDYSQINILLFGLLISGGAIFGDLFFSFLKRSLKMKPGQRWLVFDQTDYVLGAFLFLSPFLKLGVLIWLVIFILTFFLHIVFNRLGFWLKLHNSKW